MLLQSKAFWTKLSQSQTLSAAQCFTRASDRKWLLYASTRFHDVMATEFAKERRRRSCLASYCVVSDGSRGAFPTPLAFGSRCSDMTELFWGEWGREGVFAKWRTVAPEHECTCPPRMFPLEGKKRLSFSWKPLGVITSILFFFAAPSSSLWLCHLWNYKTVSSLFGLIYNWPLSFIHIIWHSMTRLPWLVLVLSLNNNTNGLDLHSAFQSTQRAFTLNPLFMHTTFTL